MLNFKIISVGWDCDAVLEQTLRSVEAQTYPHWHMHIVDDASRFEQQARIAAWCNDRDGRWTYDLRTENRGAIANQYEGILAMNPNDEDVIIYLDLDGDRLAHSRVLEHLVEYYVDGTLMTYGSFLPVPDPGGPLPIHPFPSDVIAKNSYRHYIKHNGINVNHLRTVKWKVLKRIPKSYYQWPDGEWLRSGSDYIVMIGALEISGGKHKCIDEILHLYNAAQPHPDNVYQPEVTHVCDLYTMDLPPLLKEF